ncbi:putative extracellular nuclease [Nocardioides thalensis]|uniref:Putative extracellular nuclease n=1 Tax=Nocardioides thalensis TaxID=1914755 RepID=A0A853BYN9_9ACTN|nr:endonuclease/exonuclease/phosphatase family protein [Nocardioides thalensis]NYI99601.1 putative extracellular nuclease [Nocardioides thalensis]
MNLDRFSVATVNLYNLNLPGVAMYRDVEGWSPEEYAKKLAWLSQQLKRLDADIVGFQELWHRDALAEVVDAAGMTHSYDLLAEPADGSEIWCGAIVRRGLMVGDPTWTATFPETVRLESSEDASDPQAPAITVRISGFSRPVLSFDVRLRDDVDLTRVFVAHLKSKLPTEIRHEPWYEANPELFKPHATALGAGIATIRRTAEAVALRNILTDVMKDTSTPVLVLGDLNDGQHSNTMNILTAQPRYLPGSHLGGADVGLYTAQTLQEYRDTRDVYYTHVFQDLRESLDHILLSEQFYDHSTDRLWLFDGLVINNDHLNYDDHKASGTGDHGIVQVHFKHAPRR